LQLAIGFLGRFNLKFLNRNLVRQETSFNQQYTLDPLEMPRSRRTRDFDFPIHQVPSWNPLGVPSRFSLRRVLETPPTTDDLLKFCQKVLDILTNREHYIPTLGREIPLFGPIYVRHLVTPFEAWGIKYSVVRI
jgi:hypothetical protein